MMNGRTDEKELMSPYPSLRDYGQLTVAGGGGCHFLTFLSSVATNMLPMLQ